MVAGASAKKQSTLHPLPGRERLYEHQCHHKLLFTAMTIGQENGLLTRAHFLYPSACSRGLPSPGFGRPSSSALRPIMQPGQLGYSCVCIVG